MPILIQNQNQVDFISRVSDSVIQHINFIILINNNNETIKILLFVNIFLVTNVVQTSLCTCDQFRR